MIIKFVNRIPVQHPSNIRWKLSNKGFVNIKTKQNIVYFAPLSEMTKPLCHKGYNGDYRIYHQ